MNAFWQLYKKEVRFLFGPGIGMILLMNSWLVMFAIYFISPEFYEFNLSEILQMLNNQTFAYLFAGLFLYSILHEHITKSEYQLWMLPAHRSPHLAAKFVSVMTWMLISLPVSYVFQSITKLIQNVLPWFGKLPMTARASIEVVVLGTTDMIVHILALCALVMLAYVAAMAIRRFPYLVGIATIGVGMIVTDRLSTAIYQFLAQLFPHQPGVSYLLQVRPWSTSIAMGIVAIMFIVPALLLYERFGEV